MDRLHTQLDRLAGLAHSDGGWGYAPSQPAHVEPTCLALLALSQDASRYAPMIAQAKQALAAAGRPDGSYRLARGRPEAAWPTALVLFVQAALDYPAEQIAATASWLLNARGRVPKDPRAAEQHDIDHRLVGWPWALHNFSWVEPTAWACLALKRAGLGTQARVAEGLRLLLDRALDEGGINYGNRHIFGRATEPQLEPTALMLLAWQGQSLQPRITAALRYLNEQSTRSDDVAQLSWAALALDVHDDRSFTAVISERIRRALADRDATAWLRPDPVRLALASLALGGNNPFRLPLSLPERDLQPTAAVPTSKPLGERLRGWIRHLAVEGAGRLRPLRSRTSVHIARAEDYGGALADILETQYQAFREIVPLAGKRVVLKPNLVEYHRDRVINTDPRFVSAVIEWCRRQGAAEVTVAEGPGHCRNVEYLVRASGLGDVLTHHDVRFVDLNHDEPVKCLNVGRLTGLDHLYLARTVVAADVLISLPKLKTHHWAGATLSLKNLFGTLPGICYGWPKNELHWRGIDNSIVDIALTRTPELAIVDGIIGMEGDGPLNGSPRALGAIIMGVDLLAVDATCCRLMRLNPERVGYLVLGQRKRLGLLGEAEIDQVGLPIEQLAQSFVVLPHLAELTKVRSS